MLGNLKMPEGLVTLVVSLVVGHVNLGYVPSTLEELEEA